MKVNELNNDIIYIEDILVNAAEFVDAIEANDRNSDLFRVIPAWQDWYDGGPEKTDDGWRQVIVRNSEAHRGEVKHFDWDNTENQENNTWPRVSVKPDFSTAHDLADKIINLIEPNYIEGLAVWAELTGNTMPDYITRNYCLRKYRTGGSMGSHIDRNTDNPNNTMDWSALLYLNDDYKGGEIVFHNDDVEKVKRESASESDLVLKPKAGSILFFPCLSPHSVLTITQGCKYYIFNFMHTEYNITTSLGEPYHALNESIANHRLAAKSE